MLGLEGGGCRAQSTFLGSGPHQRSEVVLLLLSLLCCASGCLEAEE